MTAPRRFLAALLAAAGIGAAAACSVPTPTEPGLLTPRPPADTAGFIPAGPLALEP